MTSHPIGSSTNGPVGGPSAAPSRAGLYAAILVVVAVGAAGAWWFLFATRTPAGSGVAAPSGPRPEGNKPYVPATHMDASRAKLSAGPDGNARVDLVLRDVGDTTRLVAKLRKGADPKSPTLFLDTATDKTGVGLLAIRFEETGTPAETRLVIDLGLPATHLTVVDLRFGGRWEGLELDASAPTGK